MKLSETDNSWPVTVTVRDGVVSREMLLSANDALDGTPIEISLDQQTATELLPALQHFIATGDLPE